MGAAIKHNNYDVVNVPPKDGSWNMNDWIIRPINGFGDKNLLRLLLATEKPDALFLFTDPRFFTHIFEIEDEIHQVCPIVWWHVWDNDPFPEYNDYVYESIDLCNCHSYKTYSMVVERYPEITNFIPHAVPPGLFRALDERDVEQARTQILGEERKDDFVAFWVNRNARRKMPGDVLDAWRLFIDKLENQYGHRNATLIMHTDPHDQEGPNLYKITERFGLQRNVMFSTQRIDFHQMNTLHNIADFYMNISCFPAGQKVMINGGLKNIEDVQPGDMALTHKGRWMPVKQTFSRTIENEALYKIKSSNNDPVTLTGEHPVLAIRKNDVDFFLNENLEKFRDMASWIMAKDLLEGDYVVWVNEDMVEKNESFIILDEILDLSDDFFIKNEKIYKKWNTYENRIIERSMGKKKIAIDEDFAYILGNWVADGSTNSTFVSFNKKDDLKAEILLEKYNKVFEGGRIREREKHIQVECSGEGNYIYSKLLGKLCGKYSSGKYVPEMILHSSEKIKRSFLEGYVAGDGCTIKNGDCFITRCRTVSDNLMITLKMLLVSLGYCPRVQLEDNSQGYGDGTIWCIDWRERKRENNGSCRSWNVGNSVISRIYKIEKTDPKTCEVYNFEVEEDHTYSLIEFNSHNCNEGFGLGTLEAMMCAKPIIALKTGGMTRQVVDHRDESENGIALEPEVRNLVGSQMVPYIYEDHINNHTVADAIFEMYEWGSEKRKEIGAKALEYALSEFNINDTIENWDKTLWDTIGTWKGNRTRWEIMTL